MKNFDFKAKDEQGNEYAFEQTKTDRGIMLTLKKENIKAISDIHALGEFTAAQTGDDGYYVIPRSIGQRGDYITRFEKRDDTELRQKGSIMYFCGLKKHDVCALIRIERNYAVSFDLSVKNDVYKLEIVFGIADEYIAPETNSPPEDIKMEIVFLDENCDYNDIARTEREIRLERGEITPLAEKCKREAVEYASKYPLIRIRQGWKPSPSPVKSQTLENEPPMHVACTFKRVRELADECKRQGVEGAEFQLVGWNVKGHDGRFPQLFPIEEELGGEAEYIKTVEHLKALGYKISTHTNLEDAYEIANTFSWDEITHDKNGNLVKVVEGDEAYGGGTPYYVCPKCQFGIAKRDYPALCALGENGTHFTDVMSIVYPRICHNPLHPLTFKQGVDLMVEIADYQKNLFGAITSEGCLDYIIDHIDYGLYISFGDGFGHKPNPFASEYIHLWEVVYHGIILYNPVSPTINYPVKTPLERLTLIMAGGKPSLYFYSKFRTGGTKNWMGEVDLTCDNDDDMKKSVALVKSALDDYAPLRHLQHVYMNRYDICHDGTEIATYADGTRIVGNFTNEEKTFEGKTIKPFDYIIC